VNVLKTYGDGHLVKETVVATDSKKKIRVFDRGHSMNFAS